MIKVNQVFIAHNRYQLLIYYSYILQLQTKKNGKLQLMRHLSSERGGI